MTDDTNDTLEWKVSPTKRYMRRYEIGDVMPTGEQPAAPSETMRIAYADPPYIGQAKKHYRHDPRCAEVDHAALIAQLETYDGWALSLSSPSLQQILALCPPDVRVAAWVKPFAAFKVGVNPAYAWEPVIYKPSPRKRDRSEPTVRDWLAASITMRKGLHGAKPEAFCLWLFDLLGMQPADTLDDLYPGTGVVGRTWETWQNSLWTHQHDAPLVVEQSEACNERLTHIVRVFADSNPYDRWYPAVPAVNVLAGVVCRWCMERAYTPQQCQHDHECLWRQARELVAGINEMHEES